MIFPINKLKSVDKSTYTGVKQYVKGDKLQTNVYYNGEKIQSTSDYINLVIYEEGTKCERYNDGLKLIELV